MHSLLKRPNDKIRHAPFHHITPANTGWEYVGFEAWNLEAEESIELHDENNETCVVILSGTATITAGSIQYSSIGDRESVFEEKAPYSVYTPNGQTLSIHAETRLELGVCRSPGQKSYPTRLISPKDVGFERRGKDTNTRLVYNILPETEPADSLLVVEVITPSGCWSSYPPHKHDQDNMPLESSLEETYYHRINPPQGFAFQRVYTEDGELDETMAVHDRDVVLVPKGYHPYGVAHGYTGYYLNVMAGPKRVWKFHNHEDHEWLLS